MSIREREPSGAAVIGGGEILPGGGTWIVDEVAIVDGVRMFIHYHPRLGGAGHVGLFEKLLILVKPPIKTPRRGIVAGAESPEDRIHCQTAISFLVARGALVRVQIIVGGAFVDTNGAGSVFPQRSIHDP